MAESYYLPVFKNSDHYKYDNYRGIVYQYWLHNILKLVIKIVSTTVV